MIPIRRIRIQNHPDHHRLATSIIVIIVHGHLIESINEASGEEVQVVVVIVVATRAVRSLKSHAKSVHIVIDHRLTIELANRAALVTKVINIQEKIVAVVNIKKVENQDLVHMIDIHLRDDIVKIVTVYDQKF